MGEHGQADLAQRWATLIRERRRERELSQRALAALMGTSQATVNRWETGQQLPRHPHVLALAEALELPVSAFSYERAAS